jgi:hypothetical protein
VKIGASNMTHTVIESGITKDDRIITGPYKELEKLKHEQLVVDEREQKKKASSDPNDPNDPEEPNEPNEPNDANTP